MHSGKYGWLVAILVSFGCGAAQAEDYQFSVLDTLGGTSARATAINNVGQIVGYSSLVGDAVQHATLWDAGKVVDLGTAGGTNSWAYGINDAGQIVGSSMVAGSSATKATTWIGGTPTLLPGTVGVNSDAVGINNSGQIVGNDYTSTDRTSGRALLWSQGTVSTLPTPGGLSSHAIAINNAGQIAGSTDYSTGYLPGEDPAYRSHATLWSNGQVQDLGSLSSYGSATVYGIGSNGAIVGEAEAAGYQHIWHAAMWNAAGGQDLGTQAVEFSSANAMNSLGQIVGFLTFSGLHQLGHAAMWSDGSVIDLNTLLDANTVAAGWELLSATGINDNGWIIGDATNIQTGLQAEFLLWPSDVPEPAALFSWLLGLGFLALAIRRRKN